jgi:hypothetical protein
MRVTEADDDEIRNLIKRLARPNASGGTTVERAAIMAAGLDSSRVIAWITEHDGQPEAPARAASGGLHGVQSTDASEAARAPARYVLPAAALS